ncbi:hypothetical protein [Nonomuraea deserti]|uniref:hypothetical protein n=1 Tax=Nonomuraea deserti TaxID=1848322 RepID=UPI001C6FEE68|nr:hypothetical protein [Nonomuraea deserti]
MVQAAGRLRNGQAILLHDQYATTSTPRPVRHDQYATTLAAIPRIAADLRSRNLCAGMISPPRAGPSP